MQAQSYRQQTGTGEPWVGLDGLPGNSGTASSVVNAEGVTAIVEAVRFNASPFDTFKKVTFRVIGSQPPGSNDSEYFLVPSGAQLSSEGGGVFSALVKDVPSLTKQHVESDDFGIAWAGYAMNGGVFELERVEVEIA